MKKLILALTIVALIFGAVSCNGDVDERLFSYTVSFVSNGGTEVESQIVKRSACAEKPVNPTNGTFAFLGWYLEDSEEKYDFENPITESITLFAHWDEDAYVLNETISAPMNQSQTIEVACTPANITGDGENATTTITFPAGSFGTETTEVTESINVIVYQTPVAATKFTVNNTEDAIAGLDLTVTVDNEPVTTFNDKVVIVTTYIAKNLTNVSIHYGTEPWDSTGISSATDVDAAGEFYYNSTTGELVFGTTHFSQFLVSADEVAYVESNQTAYLNLSDAITSATDDDTVVLLKDITLSTTPTDRSFFPIKRDLTIEGNEHKIDTNIQKSMFSVDTSDTNLTFNKLIIEGQGDFNKSAAVMIAAQNAKVNINSCDFSKNMYLIDVKNYGNPGYNASKGSVLYDADDPFKANGDKTALKSDAVCNLNIKDSKLSGYDCINWKYVGGACLVENSTFFNETPNDWTSIAIEGNGAHITVKDSEFKLCEVSNSAIFQCGAKDCTLEFINCSASGNEVETLDEMKTFVEDYNGGEFAEGDYYYCEKVGGVIMDNSGDFWSIDSGNKFVVDGVTILEPTI